MSSTTTLERPAPPPSPAPSADHRSTTGTWRLVRFMLRRDRIKLPAWILGITFFVFYFNSALTTIAATEADLAAFGDFSSGPVGAILSGPGYGFGPGLTYSIFLVGTYGLYLMLATGIMNILLVTRHTRLEEQAGRAELVRASVVGRNAPLVATLVVAVGANVVLALLISGALIGVGHPLHGSLLFGASVGAAGLAFAGITAVTVQVTEYSRGAAGMAGAALGAAYLVRAVGDSLQQHGSIVSWFSPLAWSQQTRVYVDERWWPLLLSVVFSVTMAAVAYRLAVRRDIGAGLRPPRPGAGRAPAWLASPLALAFRLERASMIGWTIALVVLGLTYGALLGPMTETFSELSEDFREILGGGSADLIGGYLSFMALYDVILVAIFAVLAVRGLASEETKGRAEPVLATGVSRARWMATYLAVAAVGGTVILVLAGLAFGVGAAAGTGEVGHIWDVTLAHLVRAPEVYVFIGVAALLYGIRPRLLPWTWALVFYSGLVTFFGTLLDPPQAAFNLSVLDHIARLPVEEFSVVPVLIQTALGAALAALGVWLFARRDLRSTA